MVILTVLGAIVGFVTVVSVSSIFSGYALSVLWSWFVAPTFGAPELSVPVAIGIALIVSYLTYQTPLGSDNKENKEEFGEVFFRYAVLAFAKPLFALLLGSIVHLFV